MNTKRISVIGLGKVGSCMVAAYASKGYRVVGYDINPTLVEQINYHEAPFEEMSLTSLLTKYGEHIEATGDIERAVVQSDISFIIVPTPSESSGAFSTEFVEAACRDIGKVLKKKKYHTIVVVSTVLPSDSKEKIIPAIEKSSGKHAGVDFGYAYSPSFIALGSIIRDILYPDLHLVGAYDARTAETLGEFYQNADDNHAPTEQMSIESAEITKIALNAYITNKITFANILADLCHQVSGADVDDVTRALGKDKRIGASYLKAGLGYGGPCFPRDNRAFSNTLSRNGVQQQIAHSVHEYNERMVDLVWKKVFANLSRSSTVGVLGLSYKPDTPYVDEAQGMKFTQKLIDEHFSVICFDAVPAADIRKHFGDAVRITNTLADSIKQADVLFISYLSAEFDPLVEILRESKKTITVIDPWRRYRELSAFAHVNYIPLGIGPRAIKNHD